MVSLDLKDIKNRLYLNIGYWGICIKIRRKIKKGKNSADDSIFFNFSWSSIILKTDTYHLS